MDLLKQYSKEIVSLIVPFVAFLLARIFRAKARLIWSIHSSRVLLTEELVQVADGPPERKLVTVSSAWLFFQNMGREPATEIEIVFNWQPQIYNIWPTRQYETAINPDGRFIVKIPNLAPKEFLGFDLLTSRGDLPTLIQCRSLQGIATKIETTPQQVQPRWKLILAAFLMFLGGVASLFLFISAIQFISKLIGI